MKNKKVIYTAVGRLVLAGSIIVTASRSLPAPAAFPAGPSAWSATTLAGLPLIPPEAVPQRATFYRIQRPGQPPLPPLPFNQYPGLPVYGLGDNRYLVDDRTVDYLALQEQARVEKVLRAAEVALGLRTASADELMALAEGGAALNPDPQYGPGGFSTNDLWLEITNVTTSAVGLIIHSPVANGVYDLYCTTNLTPLAPWYWVLRTPPGQTNLTLASPPQPEAFYILGLTNDTDGGGLPDAWEHLITQGDPQNPADDVLPLVSIVVSDSVAVEQAGTNNMASFVVSRSAASATNAVTVGLQVSGTASRTNDYTLFPVVESQAQGLCVTLAPGETNLTIWLTPLPDADMEGTETVTLTLATNGVGYQVDAAHRSAIAWILEEYTKTYTTTADFNLGTLSGLAAEGDQLQFKTNLPAQFPFINVACSDRGTVARINTTNGAVIGEYRTTPHGLTYNGDSGSGPQPSRTTVDQYGSVWVANRADSRAINGTNYGSITRIGLIIGGTRYDKSGTNYVPNARGQYVKLADALYNTCVDRDGDGYIRTSSGLADILAWNNDAGADSDGGVSTAQDEAITEYTRVPCTGTRTIAVDKFNDIWVGGHTEQRTHLKVNGLLALPVPNSAFDAYDPVSGAYMGGYGGVIDSLGNLWSSDSGSDLWLQPPTNLPPIQGTDWEEKSAAGTTPYGIAVDPLHPYIWQTSGGFVFRWHTNGTPETNASGDAILYPHGGGYSQGLAVDTNGHVWVAHQKDKSSTVGHVDTNGALVGVVSLYNNGLWAEYFNNTNLAGLPVLTNIEQNSIDYTNAWPEPPVPTNRFSARWSGTVQPTVQGDHAFYVQADAGAAFRLRVNGTTIIDNWTNPAAGSVELAGTNWLGTNTAFDVRLEYIHFTNAPLVKLSWLQPGMTKEIIPVERFQNSSSGATGISVDAAGKIWAGCYNSSTAVRIDPNAGPIVVTNGVTNHVGLVDMVVSLGDGDGGAFNPHHSPYNVAARPYNYSDMTGFNMRVVNPGGKPLKGYWTVVDDSGNPEQLWNKVSWNWTTALTNDCSIEVYVRASDDRNALGSAVFIPVTNNVVFPRIRGRYLEVRLALTCDDASIQPALYDLTLHGTSSGFIGDFSLYDVWADEGSDGIFWMDLAGAEPMGYQWFRQYPWETNWVAVAGATNSTFAITNVDSWVDWTRASVLVTNGAGESLWLGPAFLEVFPVAVHVPAVNYITGQGPATRYPMTINVFGQPTNLNSVAVTLWALSHSRSADLNLLLLSPSGKRIVLMSNIGGTNGVNGVIITFTQAWSQPSQSDAIQSGEHSNYGPSNYGQKTPQIPFGLPAGNFSSNLNDLVGDDPNGVWRLYIYDDIQPGGIGQLSGSWTLDLTFQQ